MVGWAIRGLYRRLDEKMPDGDRGQAQEGQGPERRPSWRTLLADARQQLGKREDLDKHKDIDITLQRMLRNLDPYTTYIDPETQEAVRRGHRGQLHRHRHPDPQGHRHRHAAGGHADQGQPGLQGRACRPATSSPPITREVDSDGKPLRQPEVISTKGLPLDDAVKKILGKAGTKVKLTVEREGEDKPFEFELTRGRIEVESVLGVTSARPTTTGTT